MIRNSKRDSRYRELPDGARQGKDSSELVLEFSVPTDTSSAERDFPLQKGKCMEGLIFSEAGRNFIFS